MPEYGMIYGNANPRRGERPYPWETQKMFEDEKREQDLAALRAKLAQTDAPSAATETDFVEEGGFKALPWEDQWALRERVEKAQREHSYGAPQASAMNRVIKALGSAQYNLQVLRAASGVDETVIEDYERQEALAIEAINTQHADNEKWQARADMLKETVENYQRWYREGRDAESAVIQARIDGAQGA